VSHPGKDPFPIVQEAGWASGLVWTGAENLAPTEIRSADHPARRQSLYRLHYSATSSLTSFIRNHPFTWSLIPIALLIAPVLSFHPTFLLAFSVCLYCSVLKMKTAGSSDMVVLAYECTPCHTTGDNNLPTYCYGNLNCHNI